MKKITFVLFTLVCVSTAFASNLVPNNIKSSFLKKYPHASHITWQMEPNGRYYEVDFTMKKHHYLVELNTNGEIVTTGETLTWFELPTHARKLLANEFEGFYINDLYKETHLKNVQYITHFTQNNTLYVAVFDENGKVVVLKKE